MPLQTTRPKSFNWKSTFCCHFNFDVRAEIVQQCHSCTLSGWKYPTVLKNVTNLEDGKQLPAIIDVFWALVVKQEPVDGENVN